MARGIIYIMTTVVDGIVKIGKAGLYNFEKRMYILEKNGYSNVTGLKRCFAIEVESYDEKEALLHNIFNKSRVSNTELFSIDVNLAIQTLSAFDGKVIYPTDENKEEIFNQATEARESSLIPDGEYYLETKNQHTKENCSGIIVVENGKITLKAGAVFAPTSPKADEKLKEKRKNIILKDNKTTADIECTSPSLAASLICGHPKNGWMVWKNKDDNPIDIYRQKKEEEE